MTTNDVHVPQTLIADGQALAAARRRYQQGDTTLHPLVEGLLSQANAALAAGPFTVTAKTRLAPSGDKHDYMSMVTTFWPNPQTANGYPYVWRDGLVNPETPPLDSVAIGEFVETVRTLTLACWYGDNDAYGTRAAKLARTWFLDADTRMNPNLAYAQTIPGNDRGSYFGMIEFVAALLALDGLTLLPQTIWTPDDQRGIHDWCGRLMDWMLTDELGLKEADNANNHGTWYDAMVCYFLILNGRHHEARLRLETRVLPRLTRQIEPDGRQPLELARTTGLGYSIYNLYGCFTLARLGRHVGVDLWAYQTPDGRCLHRAVDFLLPYLADESAFPYQQIRPLNDDQWALARAILREASDRTGHDRYRLLVEELDHPVTLTFELFFPDCAQHHGSSSSRRPT